MRIVADTDVCVGAGQCVLSDPALFDQSDEDGTVIVLEEKPSHDHDYAARQAVEVCPSRALSIIED